MENYSSELLEDELNEKVQAIQPAKDHGGHIRNVASPTTAARKPDGPVFTQGRVSEPTRVPLVAHVERATLTVQDQIVHGAPPTYAGLGTASSEARAEPHFGVDPLFASRLSGSAFQPGHFDSAMQLGAIPHNKRPPNENPYELVAKRQRTMESDSDVSGSTLTSASLQSVKAELDVAAISTAQPPPSQPKQVIDVLPGIKLESVAQLPSLTPPVNVNPPDAPQASALLLAVHESIVQPMKHSKQGIGTPSGVKVEPDIEMAIEDTADAADVPISLKGSDDALEQLQGDDDSDKETKDEVATTRERIPLDQHRFVSTKDKCHAARFMAPLTDLLLVLPENECRWLAKENWIFTCEQLRCTLGSNSESNDTTRRLLRKVAMGTLISDPKANVANRSAPSSSVPEDASTAAQGASIPTNVKVEHVAGDHQNNEDLPQRNQGRQTPTMVVPNGNDVDVTTEKVRRQDMSMETLSHGAQESAKRIELNSMETDEVEDLTSIVARATASYQSNPVGTNRVTTGSSVQLNVTNDDAESALMSYISQSSASKPEQKEIEENVTKGGKQNLNGPIVASQGEPTDEALERASELLQSWRLKLAKFHETQGMVKSEPDPTQATTEVHQLATQFPLNGPVSCLFPKSLLNFLETIGVKFLFSYLSMKKTESSNLIPEYRAWRSHCGLMPLKSFPLARHLTGVNIRIEKALTSIPPVDEFTQKWMSTVLVILTGSAKDFIVTECQVTDAEFFVNERTKEWSDRLVAWRDLHQMPPLKGSGKVAMISGWKTSLKESLDAEKDDGRVLTEEELIQDPPDDTTDLNLPKFKRKLSRKPGKEFKAALYKDAEVALRSPNFLASVMKPDNVLFLRSVGVSNAEQLIDVEKQIDSPITKALVKFRTEVTKIPSNANTCVRLLYDWTQRVRAKLEEIQTDASKDLMTRSGPKPKKKATEENDKRSQKIPQDVNGSGESKVKQAPKETAKKSELETSKDSEKKRNPEVKKKIDKRKRTVVIYEDPMDSLSDSAKRFFETTQIRTAFEFLSTKTTITANAYGIWRKSEGLPFLKGDGTIATISSWKAQVRKMAKAIGDDVLAATLPKGQVRKLFRKEASRESTTANDASSIISPKVSISRLNQDSALTLGTAKVQVEFAQPTPLSHKDVLMGLPCRLFSVANAEDTSLTYFFQLSVRQMEGIELPPSIFLTFLGAMHHSKQKSELSANDGIDLTASSLLMSERRVKILKEQAESPGIDFALNRGGTFSSQERGSGLIDLTKYGVGPIPAIDRVNEMKTPLRRFLTSRDTAPSYRAKSWENQTNSNVLSRETTRGPQFLFFAKDSMERGQVVELRYHKMDQSACISVEGDSEMRMYLAQTISTLSFVDLILLHNVLSQIETELDYKTAPRLTNDSIASRQRICWVATKMLDQMDELSKRSISTYIENIRYQFDLLKANLETIKNNSEFRRVSENLKANSIIQMVENEISKEILCAVETNGSLRRPLDARVWCGLARNVMMKSITLIANYVVNSEIDTPDAQTKLATQLCKCTVEATRQLWSNEKNTHDFAFDTLSSEEIVGDGYDQATSVVAVEGIEAGSIIFMPVISGKSGSVDLDVGWYAEHQIFAVVTAVAEAGLVRWMKESGKPIYTRSTIRYAVKSSITDCETLFDESKEGTGTEHIDKRVAEIESFQLASEIFTGKVIAMPSALPLFLGTIWPKLRTYGWRIDASQESIGEISFVPPGLRTRFRRVNDRNRRLRDEKHRKRTKIGEKLQNIGLGHVSKTTKRLLIQSASLNDDHAPEISVREVLERFHEDAILIPSENKDEQHRRMKLVVDGVMACFDALYPLMSKTKEGGLDDDDGENTASCTEGAHKLLQLLMVLPDILQQSGLNLRQIECTHMAVKDLAQYLSMNYFRLFEERFQPVKEEYENDDELVNRYLASNISSLSCTVGADLTSDASKGKREGKTAENPVESEIIRDLILPDDERNLTAFQTLALKQMLPCRFSANDKRKKRNVAIGYPGIVCRHCLAANGEGKYFFSSLESLSTAGGVSWSHLVRCPKLPSDIRTALIEERARHADERKALRHGAMSVYFSRLWKRLHSSNTFGIFGFTMMKDDELGSAQGADGDAHHVEFGSHIAVLQFLQSAETPLSLNTDMKDCIDTYYRCIKEGGKIYATNVMPRAPRKFSSEYLLAKMAPGAKSSLKKHTSMG